MIFAAKLEITIIIFHYSLIIFILLYYIILYYLYYYINYIYILLCNNISFHLLTYYFAINKQKFVKLNIFHFEKLA